MALHRHLGDARLGPRRRLHGAVELPLRLAKELGGDLQAPLPGGGDGVEQLSGISGLLEVLEGAQGAGLLLFLVRSVSRQDDDLDLRMLVLHPLEHLHAVDPGHPQVEDHDVRRLVLNHLQGFGSARRDAGPEIAHLQALGHGADVVLLVVHEEHPDLAHMSSTQIRPRPARRRRYAEGNRLRGLILRCRTPAATHPSSRWLPGQHRDPAPCSRVRSHASPAGGTGTAASFAIARHLHGRQAAGARPARTSMRAPSGSSSMSSSSPRRAPSVPPGSWP